MSTAPKRLRCAIYTRKSSEEGLEQSFNSLEAQREACAAYIESQRQEGWKALETRYDDGGYSGGSMERPALRALLADIDAHKVDIVVVYKVDRLTRALSDFAKIVEILDARGTSFVSVTQQFNTTSSMGRLTLNVLLSFAQFEREVTGERIRDKIAASKKKGMWMGGHVPLGYDLDERKLVVNKREAEIVRSIYSTYLRSGCVRKVQTYLKTQKIVSKRRTGRDGARTGGVPYSRGALYSILQNRLYLGEIAHRETIHTGEHPPLIERGTWEKVQARLKANGQSRRVGLKANEASLLAGLLFDSEGNRATPLHTTKRNGKRYRYYASQATIRDDREAPAGVGRVPAHEIESLVQRRICGLLKEPGALLPREARDRKELARAAARQAHNLASASGTEWRRFLLCVVSRITLREDGLDIELSRANLRAVLSGRKTDAAGANIPPEDVVRLRADAALQRKSGAVHVVLPPADAKEAPRAVNEALAKAIARARQWYEDLSSGAIESVHAIARDEELNERYVSRVLRCAFLAPNIVAAILEGTQPTTLTLDRLLRGFPLAWKDQEALLL